MLKKLFENKDDPQVKKTDQAYLEHLLAEIVREMPQVDWIALVKSDGDLSIVL